MKFSKIKACKRSIRSMVGCLAVATIVLGLSGCIRAPGAPGPLRALPNDNMIVAPVVPPPGLLFTLYEAPLQTRFSNDGKGTSIGTRSGETVAHYIHIPFVYLRFGWGDASIKSAATNGNLSTIHVADYEFLQVIGIYSRTTIKVSGE